MFYCLNVHLMLKYRCSLRHLTSLGTFNITNYEELTMTTPISLEHLACLKQPASDYLSQVYQISFKLNDLIEALKDLVSLIQEYAKSSHNLLDKGQKFFKYYKD